MKQFELPEIQLEYFTAEDVMTLSEGNPTPGEDGTPILPF